MSALRKEAMLSDLLRVRPTHRSGRPEPLPTSDGAHGAPYILGAIARVSAVAQGICELDDGRRVSAAASCLLQPEAGDRVLVSEAVGDELPALILSVLTREAGREALLGVPGTDSLRLTQRRIAIETTEELALRSLQDAELTAATGTLSLQARNLFTTVVETLVENAADRISQVGTFALECAALLRIRSRHGIVTADRQLRIDADQIHLG